MGLQDFNTVHEEKGYPFLERLLDDYLLVTEKLDGSKVSVQRGDNGVEIYKRDDRTPISLVDRTLMVYYEKVFEHFTSLGSKVDKMPKNWRFSFQYFVNESPHNIEYDRLPKNNLVITNILVKNENGKTTKVIDDPSILNEWAEKLEVEEAPILFQGKLTDYQKGGLYDYLCAGCQPKRIVKLLDENIKSYTLSKLDKHIDGLVLKFINGGKNFSFKVDDAISKEVFEAVNESSNREIPDIYSIVLLDILEFIDERGLKANELLSGNPQNRYIQLISNLFNEYVDKNASKYEGIDFETPEFANAPEFALNVELINNDKTRALVESSDVYSNLFKIFLTSLRKKRTSTTSIISEAIVKDINDLVERIKEVVESEDDGEFKTFDHFLKMKKLSEDKVFTHKEEAKESIVKGKIEIPNFTADKDTSTSTVEGKEWAKKKAEIQQRMKEIGGPLGPDYEVGDELHCLENMIVTNLEGNDIEIEKDLKWQLTEINMAELVLERESERIKINSEDVRKGNWRVTEARKKGLTVDHFDRGNKKVNIFVGRFQPFTLGHVKVFQELYKQNGHPIVVFLVVSKKADPKKKPFAKDLQLRMFEELKKSYSFLEDIKVVDQAAIDKLFNQLRPNYEPVLWGTGTDRLKGYRGQIDKTEYRNQLNVLPEFKAYEIKRGDEDISATKVRAALNNNDEETFKKLVPKVLHSYFEELQTKLIESLNSIEE